MLTLGDLKPQPGSRKPSKRVGRGQGSGRGKTATRGQKGYKSRSGSGIKPGFEGGQMPLQRRIPKRGFNNIFKKQFGIVNVRDLERFDADVRIDRDVLVAAGIVSKKYEQVKILGEGNLSKSITVSGMQVSKSAKQKIEAAGGKIEE